MAINVDKTILNNLLEKFEVANIVVRIAPYNAHMYRVSQKTQPLATVGEKHSTISHMNLQKETDSDFHSSLTNILGSKSVINLKV